MRQRIYNIAMSTYVYKPDMSQCNASKMVEHCAYCSYKVNSSHSPSALRPVGDGNVGYISSTA
jgi:hypothetical protein